MPHSASISRRFLALTIIGYTLAVSSSVLAVRLASNGHLREMQDEAIAEKARAISQTVEIAMKDKSVRFSYLARQNEIVAVTIGDEASPDAALDMIRSMEAAERLISLGLYDFLASPVVSYQSEGRPSSFFNAERTSIASRIVEEQRLEPIYAFRPGENQNSVRFLTAVPILNNGLVEGALVAETSTDLSAILVDTEASDSAQLATRFQIDMAQVWNQSSEQVFARRVAGTEFFIMLVPDRADVARVGMLIVKHAMIAVALVLVLPFGLMSLVGHRSIVAPHEALRQSREELRTSQRELHKLADIAKRSNDAIMTTDLEGRITWANPAFTATTGYSLSAAIGQTPGALLHGPRTDARERQRIREALERRVKIRSEILNYRDDGTIFWNSLSIAPMVDKTDTPYGFMSIAQDVTAERHGREQILKAKAEIEYRAFHDPLTGLPNRRALDEALDDAGTNDAPDRVLVRIDLDHFKNVNDTLGHAAGDFVLTEVSQILRENIRAGDMAIRAGGDEFVILLHEGSSRADAVGQANRILQSLDREMKFEGRSTRVGASFGIAATSDGLLPNSELLIGADAALYRAKDDGRGSIVCYGTDLHAEVVESRTLGAEMELAIERGEFEPFFQPQFDAHTLELKGVEALVRWRHPTRGTLVPSDFMKIAEQRAVIDRIDRMVFQKGLEAVSRMNRRGHFIPKISFNVVARQLESPDLPTRATRSDLGGTRVAFEVLESVLVEEQTSAFRFHIDHLKDLGFGVEVDDFGSGHASIIGLMQLAPDTMKIDQRLIFPIVESSSARQMVQAILEIAKAVDISVTAEGVESAEHAEILSAMGCDTLQGYHFARPMSGEDLATFLSSYAPGVQAFDRSVNS